MSSPLSPLTDRIDHLRQLGSTAINTLSHPGQAIQGWMAPPPAHDQAIQQMNQNSMMHKNDAANASFHHQQAPQQGVLTQQARKPR